MGWMKKLSVPVIVSSMLSPFVLGEALLLEDIVSVEPSSDFIISVDVDDIIDFNGVGSCIHFGYFMDNDGMRYNDNDASSNPEALEIIFYSRSEMDKTFRESEITIDYAVDGENQNITVCLPEVTLKNRFNQVFAAKGGSTYWDRELNELARSCGSGECAMLGDANNDGEITQEGIMRLQ